jgi:hypothetical chaperone protein
MIAGMDFGTTNSGMAIYDGKELQRLPLDPASDNPRVVRTALYVTNEQDVFIGREAIDRYFEHNVGRPVKLQKVWVGEIEVIAAEMYFVRDAYVWADVMSPGRLFLSFKTNLRDEEYSGTVIGQYFYPLESMVALYLYQTRRRAERILGHELRDVVLGRPVHFASDPKHDQLAQERLLRGAFQAGYERVYLQREPVAAAYHYAMQAGQPQNILVFDFGGGTLDITVMRLGDGRREVLATGGVPIAGDVFDQKVVRTKLPKHFGEGGRYGRKNMPIPTWIYDTFSSWQTILELQTPKNKRVLEEIEQGAQRPREIRALLSLVSNNYALQMFDIVEQTKRDLSERFGGMIRLDGPGFDVMQLITRREFENIIRPEFMRIEREVDSTLQASGLRAEQVDAVIRTGGSAQIPLFHSMLQNKFGHDRVHSIDTFGSVTSGLGIIAHGIASGEIEARPYTRDDLKQQEVAISRPNVAVVDLNLLKRRIATQEAHQAQPQGRDEQALILLGVDNSLQVHALETPSLNQTLERDGQGDKRELLSAMMAGMDEQLLLITSHYRFLLSSPRQLRDMEATGLSLAQIHHFKAREKVFAVGSWQRIKEQERLLLVTSLGYARPYPVDIIGASIEAPVPLMFEQPLPGWPTMAMGVSNSKELVLLTNGGRGLRYPLARLPIGGMQIMKREEEETLVAALVAQPDDELLLVTTNGYARRMHVEAVPVATKANTPGRVLISRRPLCSAAIVNKEQQLLAITPRELLPLDVSKIETEDNTTRSHQLLRLSGKGAIQALVSLNKNNKATQP